MKSLQQSILISNPYLKDPYFNNSVVYLYQHNSLHGAVGFVINKVIHRLTLSDIFEPEVLPSDATKMPPILIGGPLEEKNIILLHRQRQKGHHSQVRIIKGECLKEMTPETISCDLNAFLGCAGWQSGQLEKEIKNSDWLIAPKNDELLYDIPIYNRYNVALRSIGVTPDKLTYQTGHA